MCPDMDDERKKEEIPDRRELPVMNPGWYCLRYARGLHDRPGLNGPKKSICYKGAPPGMLPAGCIVLVLEVRNLSHSVWGRMENGWICMYMSHTVCAETVNKQQ